MGTWGMEDRNEEVGEAIHSLSPNPHSESRCLEHTSVDDSVGNGNWKVREYGNSLWMKVNKY